MKETTKENKQVFWIIVSYEDEKTSLMAFQNESQAPKPED